MAAMPVANTTAEEPAVDGRGAIEPAAKSSQITEKNKTKEHRIK
jgi:hypothetical protein